VPRDESPAMPLDELERDLYEACRVRGALRAVQCMLQPWRSEEHTDVQNVQREDLSNLLEVLHCDLGQRLHDMEQTVYSLQRYKRPAAAPGRKS
jgi:hypothetical protein